MEQKIPKIIHYCWFGGEDVPDTYKQYMKSWKELCPDYEIKRWDETNFPIDRAPLYVKQAYEKGKWAFVSDYVRFYVLYQYGGVYLDTDVELIKPLTPIVLRGAFMGCETDGTNISVAPGLGIAVAPEHKIYKEILDSYQDSKFITEDGSLSNTTVVRRTTDILKKHGLQNIRGIQSIDGIYIYPKEYFCPMDYDTGRIKITDSTYSIHHYSYTWADEKSKRVLARKRKVFKWCPKFCAQSVFNVINHVSEFFYKE